MSNKIDLRKINLTIFDPFSSEDYSKSLNYDFEILILLLPTQPFRDPYNFKEGIKLISKKRINYIDKCAKELLPQLGDFHDEWLGFRPTLPDFLPILGPSLKNKNIIYAFGHHHLGWTLGAITGKIISGIVAGEKTNLDLAPYSSKRFN